MIVYRAYRDKFHQEHFHGIFSTPELAMKALELPTEFEAPQDTLKWKRGKVRTRGFNIINAMGPEYVSTIPDELHEGWFAEDDNHWHYEVVPTELDRRTSEWHIIDEDTRYSKG